MDFMKYIIDDTLVREFFKHEEEAMIIFSYFHKYKLKMVIASNIFEEFIKHPLLDEDTKKRIRLVIEPYGDNVYIKNTFQDATINLVNLHSDIEQVHFITSRLPKYGTDINTDIIEKKSLMVVNPEKFVDIIKYLKPEFKEWYDTLALLKIQNMDNDVKNNLVSQTEKKELI